LFLNKNNYGCQAAQAHPVVVVVSSLNALNQIDARDIRTSLDKGTVYM